jgi:phosphoribosyl 1,2-cyclic phosphodiesterase
LIFDAGSGIKKLANHLMNTRPGRLAAKIFISHPHWDHINALPFFAPLYIPGNEIEIMGTTHGDADTHKTISAQMDDVYFPVTIREFGARVFFRDLGEENFDVGGFHINTILLSHPGNCLGYRVNYEGRSICYITDNELFPEDSPSHNPEFIRHLTEFVKSADILIADTTYLDEEYPSKTGWGHSCVREVAALAHAANVKKLHLFHHDPDQDDAAIDRKLAEAKSHLAALGSRVECVCPAEGNSYEL